ncbi:prostate androgen-regulated mucin-like protein 1 [Hemicordylus capensis]|uniref:prostate androgen-regulated mucin-like protein 1 n=1 Tax=Hemicordylus capensis TaxID=884348 RepID=UPI00230411A6|nr:prostate androgen-regulated mucin-like protein 1 [Hemicordylus capensis]
MAHRGGQTLSALFLVILAAGLNFYSASSTSTFAPSKIVTSGRTGPDNQTTAPNDSTSVSSIPISTATVTFSTPTEQSYNTTNSTATTPMVETLIPTTLSRTLHISISTVNPSPQSSTGLQSTEHTTSVTSVTSLTASTIHHSETPTITSTPNTIASSTISPNITSPNTTNLSPASTTQLLSAETSTVILTTTKEVPTEKTTGETIPASTVPDQTSSQVISANKATTDSTASSSGVTMQEVRRALSSGSIAAITITVIAVVLLVFGIAAFLKIRHSSYGRLLDDHDYGSWGNYNNPLYDDS